MQTIKFVGKIDNFENLRQQLEKVLGVSTPESNWYFNGSDSHVDIVNNTATELTQEAIDYICAWSNEIGQSWDSKHYGFDSQTGEFTENLPLLKANAKAKIDEVAGQVRAKFVTSVPGQDATYISKEAECRAYAAANYPADLTNYPWVSCEAEATGLTAQEAADAIILQANQWKVLGSTIEKIRRGGKIEVDKKLKASTIKATMDATIAQLQAI